jgi:hypothetical protein
LQRPVTNDSGSNYTTPDAYDIKTWPHWRCTNLSPVEGSGQLAQQWYFLQNGYHYQRRIITGRQIGRITAPDEQFRAGLVEHGVPEHMAEALLGMFLASRDGEFTTVDPTLAKLLGREPTTVATLPRSQLSTG